MSKPAIFGLAFIEKIIGLIISLIGAILAYYTYTNPSTSGLASSFFISVGIFLIILGIIMLTVKQ